MTKEDMNKLDKMNEKIDKMSLNIEKVIRMEERHIALNARVTNIEELAKFYSKESPISRIETIETKVDNLINKGWAIGTMSFGGLVAGMFSLIMYLLKGLK